MPSTIEERDLRVRAGVYDSAMSSGTPPTVEDLTQRLGFSRDEVQESLERLAVEIEDVVPIQATDGWVVIACRVSSVNVIEVQSGLEPAFPFFRFVPGVAMSPLS